MTRRTIGSLLSFAVAALFLAEVADAQEVEWAHCFGSNQGLVLNASAEGRISVWSYGSPDPDTIVHLYISDSSDEEGHLYRESVISYLGRRILATDAASYDSNGYSLQFNLLEILVGSGIDPLRADSFSVQAFTGTVDWSDSIAASRGCTVHTVDMLSQNLLGEDADVDDCAAHVPVITPADRPAGDAPPVIEDIPLPPV